MHFLLTYMQGGRPSDEHRFPVKCGSNFKRHYVTLIDPIRDKKTLFLGVYLDEGLFIGLDPAMHNPTWFSLSIEFKAR